MLIMVMWLPMMMMIIVMTIEIINHCCHLNCMCILYLHQHTLTHTHTHMCVLDLSFLIVPFDFSFSFSVVYTQLFTGTAAVKVDEFPFFRYALLLFCLSQCSPFWCLFIYFAFMACNLNCQNFDVCHMSVSVWLLVYN